MNKRILVMGLPGSGKSTISKALSNALSKLGVDSKWINADIVREEANDWDFSTEGRVRQANRMKSLSESFDGITISDFVCPTSQTRKDFNADITIWIDTIETSRFEDTNQIFEFPDKYDFHFTEFGEENWDEEVKKIIEFVLYGNIKRFDMMLPTVQLLGRYQPWHDGHTALFEKALSKTGQVCIMVRECQGWNGSNPISIDVVRRNIHKALDSKYQGSFIVIPVPNITNITYGRDVGYVIEKETLDDSIEAISATNIRKEAGLV